MASSMVLNFAPLAVARSCRPPRVGTNTNANAKPKLSPSRRTFMQSSSLVLAMTPFPATANNQPPRCETVVYFGVTMDGFLARPDGAVDYLLTPNDPNEDFGFAEFLDSIAESRVFSSDGLVKTRYVRKR